jgi:hypothetical protein
LEWVAKAKAEKTIDVKELRWCKFSLSVWIYSKARGPISIIIGDNLIFGIIACENEHEPGYIRLTASLASNSMHLKFRNESSAMERI